MNWNFRTAITAVCICLWAGAAYAATPRVVVTIKPIHSIVAGVMAGVAEPELLIKGGASPHVYTLAPSQAKSLARAGLVVRVSEDLESFLNDAIANLAPDAVVVTLDDTPGLTRYKAREGGLWDARRQAEDDGEKSDNAHTEYAHGEIDPHLWLDPANAAKLTARIAAALSKTWPGHAGAFAANANRLSGRLDALDREIMESTAPLRGKPYIVFHDAYHYFEARYGLRPAGSITSGPERAPGARRLLSIRRWIAGSGGACVFAEPQFQPRLIAVLRENTAARRGVLDPLGAMLDPGPDQYFELMRNLAAGLSACLAPGQ